MRNSCGMSFRNMRFRWSCPQQPGMLHAAFRSPITGNNYDPEKQEEILKVLRYNTYSYLAMGEVFVQLHMYVSCTVDPSSITCGTFGSSISIGIDYLYAWFAKQRFALTQWTVEYSYTCTNHQPLPDSIDTPFVLL